MQSLRKQFKADIHAAFGEVSALAAALVRVSSENPPGDTSAIVSFIEGVLRNECALEMRRVTAKAPIVNLIVKLRGHKPGRRLIFNGHLDTFPVGTTSGWHAPPLGGEIIDGCLYGRGASDMKAGLAVGLITAKLLAQRRTELAGEFVLALVGDEETGGIWGTQHLIANEPDGRGDAMLSADAGAPSVLRFGEKGQLWLEVVASGRASHGAHAHLGENAIERLMVALACLCELRQTHCPVPESITAAVEEASPVSEAVSGKGEKATLLSVTVNIGVILGGTSVNIVPDRASARVDVRFPPGLTVSGLVKAANASIADCPGVRLEVLSSSEANWTEPNSEIVETVARNAREAIGVAPVRNMRPGFSDARFYRLAGIPAVVFGPTPYGMGGVNEHVKLDELRTVFEVHALCAYDYLMRTKGP